MFELTNQHWLLFIGHMAQMGKKNLNLFQALHKEKATRVKADGNTEVSNLQEPLMEVHVHGALRGKLSCWPSLVGEGCEEG